MTTTRLVVKRDRSIQEFDPLRIYQAIYAAFQDIHGEKHVNLDSVHDVADYVYEILDNMAENEVEIERIQKLIQAALMHKGYFDEAETFILYRKERADIRKAKQEILEKDSLDSLDKSFTFNQLKVLASRYLLRDLKTNELLESPADLFRRVATLIGLSDLLHDPEIFDKDGIEGDWVKDYQTVTYDKYFKILDERFINKYHFERFCNLYNQLNNQGKMKMALSFFMDNFFVKLFDQKYEQTIEEYYQLMTNCQFMPNTPTLMNAGTRIGGLSACFVLHAPDSIDGYVRVTTGDAAAIYRMAGGVGINWSDFRPEGCDANGTPNAASGPVSFIAMINTLTDVVKGGGKRRGANMGILDINHPDIEKFIAVKTKAGVYENFNLSVGIWEDYWEALTSGKSEFQLFHKTHHQKDRLVNPQQLWDLIARSAWDSAEPGVIFFDNINRVNHMRNELGPIRATNPCGEQALPPNASCTLGSINIAKFVDKDLKVFKWGEFAQVIRQSTRFLDNVVSMNKYPTEAIEEMALQERRLGLGVMGVADALYMLRIPYNSKEGFEFMATICRTLTSVSMDESINLAKERGPAPLFNFSTQGIDINNIRTSSSLSIDQRQDDLYKHGIRNTWNTTVAPTGTIAMIADTSYGIEPEYALVFKKKVTIGEFYYANEVFAKALKKEGLYTEDILKQIADNGGSCQSVKEIPQYIKDVFVTAMDIHWADHIMAQGVCQQYIDNSISKTINMAADVMVDDVKNAYLLAHELGCKGMTVYRDNSRNEQVLHTNSSKTGKQLRPSKFVIDYIKQRVTNPYVKDKLYQFFNISDNDFMEWSIPEIKLDSNQILNNIVHSGGLKITVNGRDDICHKCGSKMVFIEGCKICNTCQEGYCNV